MGEDNLSTLHKWKNAEELVKRYPLIVYPRLNPGRKTAGGLMRFSAIGLSHGGKGTGDGDIRDIYPECHQGRKGCFMVRACTGMEIHHARCISMNNLRCAIVDFRLRLH